MPIDCTGPKVVEEVVSFSLLAGAGTLGAYLFTTLNPLAGLAFGAAYYGVSKIVQEIAKRCLNQTELTETQRLISNVVAIGPAIGIACGILVLASCAITPAAMAIIAASTFITLILIQVGIWAIKEFGTAGLAGVGLCCCALIGCAAANRATARI